MTPTRRRPSSMTYPKFNARRKPELLAPTTYSLTQHGEADRVVSEFTALAARADAVYRRLPSHKRDAFYQLVLQPTLAAAQVNELYVAAGKNALYASQGRASTNEMAARVRQLFKADQDLMRHFNKVFAGGKWDHFMDQPHLGYTSWRDPPVDSLDAIPLVERSVPETAGLGVAVDGSPQAWPGPTADPALPTFDSISQARHFVDVFNRGRTPFDVSVIASDAWIMVDDAPSRVERDTRFWISIDWEKAPAGRSNGSLSISGAGQMVRVAVSAFKPEGVTRKTLRGSAESQGFVSIEAVHFTGRDDAGAGTWLTVEDYGHTAGGMRATAPVDAPAAQPGKDAPRLDYLMHLFTPGELMVRLTLAPSLNFLPDRAIRIAVAIDDDEPQILTVVPSGYRAENGNRDWETAVSNNARVRRIETSRGGARRAHAAPVDGRSRSHRPEDPGHDTGGCAADDVPGSAAELSQSIVRPRMATLALIPHPGATSRGRCRRPGGPPADRQGHTGTWRRGPRRSRRRAPARHRDTSRRSRTLYACGKTRSVSALCGMYS